MGTYSTFDDRFRSLLDRLFANGWQPADVAHLVKRRTIQRQTRLMLGYLAQHARRTDAATRAPLEWVEQLHELGVLDPATGQVVGGHGEVADRWARTEKLDHDEVLDLTAALLLALSGAPRLSELLTPPERWGASNKGLPIPTAADGQVDGKALRTIRALLAKAEGTTFEAEAEAFTAKAQELMTRHSIDAAVLAAHAAGAGSHAGIRSRRVHIDNPYADEKATFLSALAHVNGAKCVWSPSAGFSTVMGFPVDLQLTEVLFTSLLVQATHASASATAHDSRLRTPSFRRAFLVSFADRIAERLESTRTQVTHDAEAQYGSTLAPVLAQREAAVEQAYTEAFPNVTLMASRRYNAHGWHAGRAAADRADLGAGAAIDPAR
jgi:hypothetical protein